MKNRGKQKRSKDTIQTILAAATNVLMEHGYEKATTNRISERAGYSVGTVYQYFDDKEDIYAELIDQTLAQLVLAAANCPIQATLKQTLKQLLAGVLQRFEQNPALIQALEAVLAGQFRDKRSAAYETLIASTTKILEAHRDEVVVEDLELAARVIVGAAEGMSNAGNAELIKYEDLETHLLRLQFAYLTMKY